MLTHGYLKTTLTLVGSMWLFIRKPFFLFCNRLANLNLYFDFDLIYKLGQDSQWHLHRGLLKVL